MAPAAVPSSSSARMSPYISSSQPQQGGSGGEKSDLLKGLQDVYWSDEEEEDPECPLCMEEMDLSDINFKPCPCGYQICRFCHHHILANLNKRCPACRRQYTEDGIEFIPVGAEEIKRLTALKKTKAKTNKELEALGRRHLKDVRVVVKNMVYVVGMGVGQEGRADEQLATLRSNDYFGQYGKISKLVLHKRPPSAAPPPSSSSSSPPPPNVGIYITYLRREDAARAISALDGFPSPSAPGQVLRASFGTTKYCEAWLRGVKCDNVNCLGLHDWGDERDCFTKEDLSTLKHTLKGTEHLQKPVIVSRPVVHKKVENIPDASALPRTASWASRPGTGLASLPPNPTLPAPPGLKAQMSTPTPAQAAPVVIRLQTKPKATTSSPAASSSTPQQVTILSKPTPVKSSSKAASSTAASSVSAPSNPSSRPGTPASASAKASIGIVSSTTNRSSSSTTQPTAPSSSINSTTPSTPTAVSAAPAPAPPPPPPPPPGLGPPGLVQQSAPPPNLEPIPAHLQSPYHPSSQTQALVDEITARREAPGPPAFASSPFPDFDHMLSTFGDGQFSFNLNLDQQKDSASSRTRHAEPDLLPPSAFSPFGFGLPTQGGSFGLLPTEPRHVTPYAGSFDPWGDAPRAAPVAEAEPSEEQGGKKSRFDFARRKTSTQHFGASPSPNARSLALPNVEGDSRRGSIDSDSLLAKDGANGAGGGRFNRDSGRITPTPSSTDASSYLWSGTSGHHDPPPHQYPQHHQQARSNASSPAPFGRHPPPGLPASSAPGLLTRQTSNNSSNFAGSPAPPPGLGLKSPLQGQQHQPLRHQQPGGAGNWIHQLPQQQQQQQQGSIGSDASRMAFARQQQQGYPNGAGDRSSQAQALKDMLGVGSGMNFGSGAGGAGAGMGMGLGMGGGGGAEHNHMPFQDPAIMSMRMNTAAQQQQQQQHQYSNNSSNGQQQPFSPEQQQQQLGMHGVGGTTDPASLGAFAAFASQSLNVGNARLLQQIQHQQQQQGYYGVQGGGNNGRGPSPSPPLGLSRPDSPASASTSNPFDFPPLASAPAAMSSHASRFIQAQAAHQAAQHKNVQQSPPTPGQAQSSTSSSTPLRPTDVQIAIQSATPGTPQAEWSSDQHWQAESPSRLGAHGWTPGLERRRSLEQIEGRMSREEEDRVEELVGEADEEEEDEELRRELEEVERQVEALEGLSREQTREKEKGHEQQLQRDRQEAERVLADAAEQARLVATEQARPTHADSPTSSPELPTFVPPATPPDADEVRAAVRAAAADKPKPVTISLRSSKPAAVDKPAVVAPVAVVEDKKEKTSTVSKTVPVAAKSQQSTPASTRPATPSKASVGKASGKAARASTAVETPAAIPAPTAPVAPKPAVVATSAPKTKLELHKEAQALALAKATEAAAARAAARPVPPPAAPTAATVEQAPMTSKMAKKAKVPKAKRAQPGQDEAETESSAAAVEDAVGDELDLLAENEMIVEGEKTSSSSFFKISSKPVNGESTPLPELLHQVSYLIDCNQLAFFSPTLPCTSLPLPANADPALTPSNLALALSALSSTNPTVSMEEAVGSFHVLLTHLTGRISEVLGVLPRGGREGTQGMALTRRFDGMFGGEEGGDGFEDLDYDDEEDEQAAGGGKGDEVERLRGALGRRAAYLARQLGRLEELHGEINGIALDTLLPRYAATAPSYASTSAQSSLQIEEELERAREVVEMTTRELEEVMHLNAVAFGEVCR